MFRTSDFLWNGPGAAEWSVIELNVGIIWASVSTLRPLLSCIHPRVFRPCSRSSAANQPSAYFSRSVITRCRVAQQMLESVDEDDSCASDDMRRCTYRTSTSTQYLESHSHYILDPPLHTLPWLHPIVLAPQSQ